MSAPIPNQPSLADQQALSANASFAPGPTSPDLCGFELPTFVFRISVNIPGIAFPPALPRFIPSLGISCAAINPIDVSSGVPYGGGRVATFDANPDDQFDQTSE